MVLPAARQLSRLVVCGLACLAGAVPSEAAGPYSFHTLAGMAGSIGSTDGTGSAARFNSPGGVAVDAAGTVYVADGGNHTVRRITPAGTVSTFAGLAGSPGSVDGTGSAARFTGPGDIAVDAAGTVYVVDGLAIRKITPAAVVSTLMTFPSNSSHVGGLRHIAAAADGTIYFSESHIGSFGSASSAIYKLTPAGSLTQLTQASTSFNFRISGVAVNASGTVYFTDDNLSTIRTVSPSGAGELPGGVAPGEHRQ